MADQHRASFDNPIDQQTSFSSPEHHEFDNDDFNEDYASSIHTTVSRTGNPFETLHDLDEDDSNPFDDTVSPRLSIDLTPSVPLPQPQSPGPLSPSQDSYQISGSQSLDTSFRNNEDRDSVSKSNAYFPPSNQLHRQQNPIPLHLRTLSIASSSSSYAPAGSPITQDGNGPSHPYAMYPQVLSMSRPASIASVSTLRHPSRAHSRRGPAHPYALYPQNVGVNDLHSGSATSHLVGFPGHQQGFHRRVGLEGEEQDIVGEDGHAEQLPPYSQFPEDNSGPKLQISSNTGVLEPIGESSNAERSGSPQDRIVEMQQQSSTDNLNFNDIQRSSVDDSTRPLRAPSAVNSDEESQRGLWWRRKVCGIPLSLILIFIFVVVVISIACGAAVAAVMRHHGHKDHQKVTGTSSIESGSSSYVITAVSTVTTTAYIGDASFTSTSAAPAPPQTGTFSIPISYALATNNNCITIVDLQPAWACMMNNNAIMQVTHNPINNLSYVSMSSDNPTYGYGTQPPQFPPQVLSLVEDIRSPNLGPAYFFQTYYDKLVIVHYLAFPPDRVIPNPNSTVGKRLDNNGSGENGDNGGDEGDSNTEEEQEQDLFHLGNGEMMFEMGYLYSRYMQGGGSPPVLRAINNPWTNPAWPQRDAMQEGDKVWFCYWNQTMIEGFLYTENFGVSPAGGAPSAVTNPTDYSQIMSQTPLPTSTPNSGQYTLSDTAITPTPSPSSSFFIPSPSLPFSQPPSETVEKRDEPYKTARQSSSNGGSVLVTTTSSVTLSSSAPQTSSSPTTVEWSSGKFLKLQERRIPGTHITPYCQAKIMNSNGELSNLDVPVKYLPETDPPALGQRQKKRDTPSQRPNACFCQWIET